MNSFRIMKNWRFDTSLLQGTMLATCELWRLMQSLDALSGLVVPHGSALCGLTALYGRITVSSMILRRLARVQSFSALCGLAEPCIYGLAAPCVISCRLSLSCGTLHVYVSKRHATLSNRLQMRTKKCCAFTAKQLVKRNIFGAHLQPIR